MASYPTSVKTFTTKNDGAGNTIFAAHVNDLQDEVHAIEDGLLNGTAPINSSHATVSGLDAGNSTITNLSGTNSTITNMVAFSLSATHSTLTTLSVANSTITAITAGQIDVTAFTTISFGLPFDVTLANGNTDNLVVPQNVFLVRITGNSSGSTLTGIASMGGFQRLLMLVNVAAPNVVLKHGGGSASTNQFLLPGAADFTLNTQDGVLICGDTNTAKWRSAMS